LPAGPLRCAHVARGRGANRGRTDQDAEAVAGAVLKPSGRGELLTAFGPWPSGARWHPGGRRVAVPFRLSSWPRTGSTTQAMRRYHRTRSVIRWTLRTQRQLQARLTKDLALMATGADVAGSPETHPSPIGASATVRIGYFPAINAATLSLLSGDALRAAPLPRRLAAAPLRRSRGRFGRYLGSHDSAQLRLNSANMIDTDPILISPLAGPAVGHFCGHRIAAPGAIGRFPQRGRGSGCCVGGRSCREVSDGIAYGSHGKWRRHSVGGGPHGLVAGELHIVLPFSLEEFILPRLAAGDRWIARFHRCLQAATSVTFARRTRISTRRPL